jgi:gliding motility-associated-like protein
MKSDSKFLVVFLAIIIFYSNRITAETSSYTTSQVVDYIENKGQWPKNVFYRADLSGGYVYLEDKKLTYLFFDRDWHKHGHNDGDSKFILQGDTKILNKNHNEDEHTFVKGHVYTTEFLGGNNTSYISSTQRTEYYFNYFIGNDPGKWASNVFAYKTVVYNNVYEGIDVKIGSAGTSLKTDYIVHPKAEVSKIKIKYNGIDKMYIDDEGNLVLKTSINDVKEFKPYTYQTIDGELKEIKSRYILEGNVVSFEILEEYNKNLPLIIDPTLVFSTYSGSIVDNWGSSATYDTDGNMYLGGIALGPNYPTTVGAFQTTFGGGSYFIGTDVVITKFRSNGTSRIYSTYLGGIDNELLTSLYNSPDNRLVALIVTGSDNYPVTGNAYDRSFNGGTTDDAMGGSIFFENGSDLAITRLETSGNALVGSTYFGGSGNDGLNKDVNILFNYGDETRGDLEIASDNSIFISSTTNSRNIPGTSGKSQPSYGGGVSDGVIAKFNSNLSSLLWATYYGGSDADASYYIELDGNSNIFITGGTTSTNLANKNSGLNSNYLGGRSDGYIAKMNPDGSNVLVSTYLGTSSYDQSFIINIDKSNNVVAYGSTLGNYPTTSGVYKNNNAKQFFHKLNNNLNSTVFSTTFGNPDDIYTNLVPTSLLIDICGNIYAAGWGGGPNAEFEYFAGYTREMPITSDAYKSTTDNDDFYFISINSDATSLLYGSYFGENGANDHVDGGTSKFDKNGIIYQAVCASCGGSDNFPTTPGAYSRTNHSSNCNMAGVKFQFDLKAMQITGISATPNPICIGTSTTFSFNSSVRPSSVLWNFGDGSTSTQTNPSHTFNTIGTFTVKLVIQNPTDCNPTDSSTYTVIVRSVGTSTIDRTICQGETTSVGNQTFSQAGTYTIRINTGSTCDSVVTLHLKVNPNTSFTLTRTICQGDTAMVNGQSYNAAGTYTISLNSSNGCDSILTFILNVNPDRTATIQREICQGSSITVGGQTFTSSGTYNIKTTTSLGCDSTINLTLNVNSTPSSEISRTICSGGSVTVGNQTFTSSGTYTIRLTTWKGCDSTITLQLQVRDKLESQITQAICEGDSIFFGNKYYKSSGAYTASFISSSGCDSTVTLYLSIIPTTYGYLYKEICPDSSYVIGGNSYNTTGIYTLNLQSSSGCDSALTLQILVTNLIHDTITYRICEGDSIIINGTTYYISGNYQTQIVTQVNCDTLLTFDIVLLEKDTINQVITLCNGDSVMIENKYYSEAGIYSFLHSNQEGCDSLTNITIEILPTSFSIISDSICAGDTLPVGQEVFTVTGQYQVVLTNQYGCDSTINIDLFVEPPLQVDISADSTTVNYGSQVGLQLSPTSQDYIYNWKPQQGLSSYSSANTMATITADITYYGSVITALGCISTDSITIYLEDCKEDNVYLPNAFSPNGDHNHDVYYVVSSFAISDFRLMIFDRWGEKVFETRGISEGWDGTFKGKPAAADSYAYVFEGKCGDVTIKKQGNITLIR